MRTPILATLSTLAALHAASAQQPVFTTPGMPPSGAIARPDGGSDTPASGQTDRFSSVFNPAFSFVVDVVGDALEADDDATEDGIGLEMRVLEVGAQSWVDPDAWAYFVGATDGDEVAVEEAAIHYVGLGANTTLRAGRFFVDFGKQMQTHVHELRTLERPLVLRTYLGEEVKGDGLQYGAWTDVGEATALRWSLGVFANLLPESELEDGRPVREVADRKDAGDLNFTARATAFTDAGTNGVLQLGASGRWIPDASAELNGTEVTGLEDSVYGLDLTYGWTSDDARSAWTTGAEFLVSAGDTVALVDDMGTAEPDDDALQGFDDQTRIGWYAFVDYGWARKHAVGTQYSATELGDGLDASEIELYYTRRFSELHRLRLVGSSYATDADGGDSLRFAIQYTAAVGAHGHGVDW